MYLQNRSANKPFFTVSTAVHLFLSLRVDYWALPLNFMQHYMSFTQWKGLVPCWLSAVIGNEHIYSCRLTVSANNAITLCSGVSRN
jgi:hypothetical protein